MANNPTRLSALLLVLAAQRLRSEDTTVLCAVREQLRRAGLDLATVDALAETLADEALAAIAGMMIRKERKAA